MKSCRIALYLAFVLFLVAIPLVQAADPQPTPPATDISKRTTESGHDAKKPVKVLSFSPATTPVGRGVGSTLAMGSVKATVVSRDEKYCTFDYTLEIEQGENTYRCRVPVSDPNVTISVDAVGNIATSFKLETCQLLRVRTPWFDYRDVKLGKGAAPQEGKKVRFRYSLYADEKCTQRMDGFPADKQLEADLTATALGGAVGGVLRDMKVGGTRRASIARDMATGFAARANVPNDKKSDRLYVEVELLSVE